MRLTFWQQLASPHQAPFIRELAAQLGPGGVTCVFTNAPERSSRPLGLELGWAQGTLDFGAARVLYMSGTGQSVADRLAEEADTIHIVSSLVPDPVIRSAYRALVRKRRTIGLLSEARDWRGWRGALRRADSLRHERTWRRDLSFVLAMGSIGRRWYDLCGYESNRILDFCYTVETPIATAPSPAPSSDFRVLFVGQLIRRKRVDLLLQAIASLRDRQIALDIVGAGPLESYLQELTRTLHVSDKVRFLGGLRNSEVNRLLAATDVLVLPSHWDGWGAVVNEAMSNGARVVCSDFCGAADLVSDIRFGKIFREGSSDSLAEAIDTMIRLGKISGDERAAIRTYSSSFAGPAVAKYLLNAVAWATSGVGDRPAAPWRNRAAEFERDSGG